MPTANKQTNNTDLNDGINVEDESKTPVGHTKYIFRQTSINDQRPKLRVSIKWYFYWRLTRHRCGCNYHYSIILASELTSSRDRCSVPKNWNPISSKAKQEVGWIHRAREKSYDHIWLIQQWIYEVMIGCSNGIPRLTFLQSQKLNINHLIFLGRIL